MQNSNVCRLCLKLVDDANMELLNPVTRKMLTVLLIKLDLDVTDDPLVCKVCVGILNEIYTFKSKCLDSEDIITTRFESNLKVSLRDILELKNEPSLNVAQNDVICRLCIKIPANDSYVVLNETDEAISPCRGIMQMQLPEINLGVTKEPIICETCYEQLKKYLYFATSCVDVEKKIKMYREHEGSDVKEQVDLLSVLQFTENKALDCENSFNGDLVVNQEESFGYVRVDRVEDEEDNLSEDHSVCVSDLELYYTIEEVELNLEDDQISSDQLYVIVDEEYQGSHKYQHHMGRQKVILQCSRCKYRTRNRSSLSLHKKTHYLPKHRFKCERCEYSTYLRSSLIRHQVTHMGEPELHKCRTCDFRTKYKYSLICHEKSCLKKKRRRSSRALFQCNRCDYHTISREYFKLHKRSHDPTKPAYKCEHCEYSTYIRAHLNQHRKTHMELEETVLFYCATCDFKSKYKSCLREHVKKCSKDGTDPRVILLCDQCDFHTTCRHTMYFHKKVHDPTEKKLKCQQCEYDTYRPSSLKAHMKVHLKPGEAVAYSCTTCDFKTLYKKSLKNHLKRCSRKVDGTDSRVTLQCDHCDYHTKSKEAFGFHNKTHDPTAEVFKCEQCEYSTHLRVRLNRHLIIHKALDETAVYYCATCDYKTKYKGYLRIHVPVCAKKIAAGASVTLDPTKSPRDFKLHYCTMCNFETKYKSNLTKHMKICSKKKKENNKC